MRAVFGIVGLLIAVGVVGLLAKKQLQAVGAVSVAPAVPGAQEALQPPARGTPASVREQSQQLQRQVAEDVAKALSQGAARASEPLQ
jgi:hypothetical protein